jgi:NADPH2:quinone reductase
VERVPEVWNALLALFDSGKLKPAIYDKVYNLQTIPDGLKAIANRETFAKVVARISGPDSKI